MKVEIKRIDCDECGLVICSFGEGHEQLTEVHYQIIDQLRSKVIDLCSVACVQRWIEQQDNTEGRNDDNQDGTS